MKKLVFVAAGYIITQLSAEVLADEFIENNNDIIDNKDEVNIDNIVLLDIMILRKYKK